MRICLGLIERLQNIESPHIACEAKEKKIKAGVGIVGQKRGREAVESKILGSDR